MSLYAKFNDLGNLPAEQVRDPSKPSKVIHISNTEQKRSLIRQNLLCVIDLYADWCGPCKYIATRYENYADNFSQPGRCVLCKEDVGKKIDPVGSHPDVRGVPTFLFYINGEVQNELTIVGADIDKVEQTIRQILNV